MHDFSVLLRTCFYPRENNRIWSHTGNLFSAFNSFSPITNLMRLKININIFFFLIIFCLSFYQLSIYVYFYLSYKKFSFIFCYLSNLGPNVNLNGGREDNVFLEAISLRMIVLAPSPKIVITLPRIYEKLQCKGEPYRFSGTDRQTNIVYCYISEY